MSFKLLLFWVILDRRLVAFFVGYHRTVFVFKSDGGIAVCIAGLEMSGQMAENSGEQPGFADSPAYGLNQMGADRMTSSSLQLVDSSRMIRGAFGGVTQPSVIFSVKVADRLDHDLPLAKETARALLTSLDAPAGTGNAAAANFISVYLDCIASLLTAHQHPVFHRARILSTDARPEGFTVFTIQQPCLDFTAGLAAILLSAEHFAAAFDPDVSAAPGAAEACERHRENLQQGQLKGFNAYHFLKTAHDMNVPWFRISGDTFQYGYGRRARLLNSSFSDRTPWIGNTIAKNKAAASRVLRLAGLPVAEQVHVTSQTEALDAAERIGFPVVVKPVDLDGGVGVTAFLTEPDDVVQAYEDAARLGERVVVEKHFQGRDYRIQVVEGEVQGLLERVPGGVTGDGNTSVADLILRQNQERKLAEDDRRFLHPINIDTECKRQLRIQGMTLESVPAEGAFVRLRGAANVASGGVPLLLDVAEAHVDNLDLALRATRVTRLDIAGVDLIIPDISRSWLETGAIICEVNAQPQMFTTFHQPMLERLLGRARGHIPTYVVLEPQDSCTLGGQLFGALAAKQPNVGYVSAKGVFMGGQPVGPVPVNLFDAARSLLMDPNLQSLVLSLPEALPLADGWPITRCDAVIVNDTQQDPERKNRLSTAAYLTEIGLSLRPRAAYFTETAAAWAGASEIYRSCSVAPVDFEQVLSSPSAQIRFAHSVLNPAGQGQS